MKEIFVQYKQRTQNIKLKDLRRQAKEIIKESINRLDEELIWGGDPEFAAIVNDHYVYASDYIRNGCRDCIGTDGDSRILEIRPEPAKTPYELLKNFYKMLKKNKVTTSEYTKENILNVFDSISSNCQYLPLGGHIHVGGKTKKMISFLKQNQDTIVMEINNLVFDNFYNLSTEERQRSPFMQEALEGKPYGFEYRTPPSIVWLNPKLMNHTIKLIRTIIAKEYTYQNDITTYYKVEREFNSIINRLKKYIDKNCHNVDLIREIDTWNLGKYRKEIEKIRDKKQVKTQPILL